LFFIVLLRIAAGWAGGRFERTAAVLVAITGCQSLAAIPLGDNRVWFIEYWFYFASGALCCWAVREAIDRRLFYGFSAVFAGAVVLTMFGWLGSEGSHRIGALPLALGLGTSLSIYAVGRAGRLTSLWNHPVIQYFGRISYSLYLVHLTVAVAVLQAGYKLTGTNEGMALLWFALAGALSIGAAHLLFVTVERPFMKFASAIRRSPTTQPSDSLPQKALEEAA
jgi:peptidoglycan/LPS O-acetylase OafA/YrhL